MLALKKFIPCYAAALCIKTHAALLMGVAFFVVIGAALIPLAPAKKPVRVSAAVA
jgi:hypothetical protein